MPLFKFPRALVRNAVKLEQLQTRLFVPLFERVERLHHVATFRSFGLEGRAVPVPGNAGGYEYRIGPVRHLEGPLAPGPLGFQAAQKDGYEVTAGETRALIPSRDRRGEIAFPVLLRNAKEHEPAIMQAWESLETGFQKTLGRLAGEVEGTASDLKKKYGVEDTRDLPTGSTLPRVNYGFFSLLILQRRLGIPTSDSVVVRPEVGELMLVMKCSLGNNLGGKEVPLQAEWERADQTECDLRPAYAAAMDAHAASAHEIMEALREVLALVPGENPPLEYDASTGVLTFGDKQTHFTQGTASKGFFDRLVLYRGATQKELLAEKEQAEEVKRKANQGRSKKQEVEDPKEILRVLIREMNKKFDDNKIPLQVVPGRSGPRSYRLSDYVSLPEP